ncbi:MAG: TRAM domain-containing protein [Acidobacteria bacterium]|nr:TRAM domain-containing protein [Acidobacteriota bacterium]
MDLWIIRALLLAAVVAGGYFIRPFGADIRLALICSGVLGIIVILAEMRIRRLSVKTLLGAAVGSVLGIIGASLISIVIGRMNFVHPQTETFLQLVVLVVMAYVGLIAGANKGEYIDLTVLEGVLTDSPGRKSTKVLDTSVVIDGRIADICTTGFLEGTLIVPHFVLRELQQIADSADSAKRNRGRRGLDVLEKIKSIPGVNVQLIEKDYPDVKEVDLKLIELAKEMGAKIVTNDFNLNKVSQLRGVDVLNINELANALKPVVLPGETMKVFILKEGKEYNQGVAYLDDGTMVVVDNARRMIGKTIATQVTSVLQTTAGKMIFGRFPEETENGSGYSSRQDRRSYDRMPSNQRNGVDDERERVKGR